MAMGKEAGKLQTDYWYTVLGKGVYSVVDDVVVEIKYMENNEAGLNDADFLEFQARWNVGSGWTFVKNADTGNLINRKVERPDGSTGVFMRSKTSMTAIFRLGSWLKSKEEYNNQPWYKKVF